MLGAPSLRLLGEASYAIYILQFPLSYLFGLNNETFTPLRFLTYLVSLIGLSVLTFLFIEQPSRRWLRSRRGSRIESTEARPDRPSATQGLVAQA